MSDGSMTDEESGRAEAEVGAEIAAEAAAQDVAEAAASDATESGEHEADHDAESAVDTGAERTEPDAEAPTETADAGAPAETADAGGGDATPPPDEEADRGTALVLARLHLRLGSLALARAELETLAVRGSLDTDGRVDLAEARWRTGDLVGGGEAAREALAGGREAVVALVVAAEAASALGRPSEARRLAGHAMDRQEGAIDPVFAGMPRSSVWPSDPAEPVPSPTTLFPPERTDSVIEADREGAAHSAAEDRVMAEAVIAEAAAAADASAASIGPGLWDLEEAAAAAAAAAAPDIPSTPPELEPSALFDAGRTALEAGDHPTAAVNLGLVVRMTPGLAPAILSLIGDPTDAGLLLVQGDAYRAIGHEFEATRAYAAARSAASTPGAGTPPPERIPEAEPVVVPHPARPDTGLWWLAREREPAVAPEVGAEPEAASEPDSLLEAGGEPDPPADEAIEADRPADVAEGEPSAEPDSPTEPDHPAEPDAPAEPEPELESGSPPEFEPDRESEWPADNGGWREDPDDRGSGA